MIETDERTGEQVVPARRLAPKDHLHRAASSPIASNAEQYHLAAAGAEALARIEEHVTEMRRALWTIAEHLTSERSS